MKINKTTVRTVALYGTLIISGIAAGIITEHRREANYEKSYEYMEKIKRTDAQRYRSAMKKYTSMDSFNPADARFWKREYKAMIDSLKMDSATRTACGKSLVRYI